MKTIKTLENNLKIIEIYEYNNIYGADKNELIDMFDNLSDFERKVKRKYIFKNPAIHNENVTLNELLRWNMRIFNSVEDILDYYECNYRNTYYTIEDLAANIPKYSIEEDSDVFLNEVIIMGEVRAKHSDCLKNSGISLSRELNDSQLPFFYCESCNCWIR